MSWYIAVLKKYAVFGGRAQRAEFWYFTLFNVIVGIIMSILDTVLSLNVGAGGVGILYIVYSLAVLIPALAVSVRRLHDTDRSGWFVLVSLIPVIGAIWLIILFVQDGTPGDNSYGGNPKAVTV